MHEQWERFGVVIYMSSRHIFIFDSSTSKANRLERKPILGAFELQRCVVAARVRLRAERPPHTATARVFSVLTGTDTCTYEVLLARRLQVRNRAPARGRHAHVPTAAEQHQRLLPGRVHGVARRRYTGQAAKQELPLACDRDGRSCSAVFLGRTVRVPPGPRGDDW